MERIYSFFTSSFQQFTSNSLSDRCSGREYFANHSSEKSSLVSIPLIQNLQVQFEREKQEAEVLSTPQQECKEKKPEQLASTSSSESHVSCTPPEEEVLPLTQKQSMHRQPQSEFLSTEVMIMKKTIEENVIPAVKYGMPWDSKILWQEVCRSYNVNALANHLPSERSIQEVFAIAKRINWCTCSLHGKDKDQCGCDLPRIPESIEPGPSMSMSVSSRKRSYDDSSDTSLAEEVANMLNSLAEHGHITESRSRDAAMFYSNLIRDGKDVVVLMFVKKQGVEEKLNHMRADFAKFPDYVEKGSSFL